MKLYMVEKVREAFPEKKGRPETLQKEKGAVNVFFPQLAEKFGIIVRVNEKNGEILRLGESSGLQRTRKIHSAAAKEQGINREEMVVYVDEGVSERGGVARRNNLEKISLGELEIGEKSGQVIAELHKDRAAAISEVLFERRAVTLEEVLEIEGIKEQLNWNDEKDGLWIQTVWEVASILREGKKIKDLSEKQKEAWGSLGSSHQEAVVIYQELMQYYGIDPRSMFGRDGILKTIGGESLSMLIKDLNERQKPPAVYQRWEQNYQYWQDCQKAAKREPAEITKENWQKERYGRYCEWVENEKNTPLSFEAWQKLDNKKMAEEEDLLKMRDETGKAGRIDLAELMIHIENKRMGDVVHACLSTEMELFLDKAKGGETQLPVSYAIASESGKEGIIFTNFFGERIHDEMVTALKASGDFYFWQSVGRFERMLRFTQTGFSENRLPKTAWQTLEGVSPPAVQFMLLSHRRLGRAFGEALMLPELVGVRDWRTGRPGMYQKFDALGIAQPPIKDEAMADLEPDKQLRESARRKMEIKGYPKWVADLAMAHCWLSGEGVDIAQQLAKIRAVEDGFYGLLGAIVEPFYEYDGKALNKLRDSQGETGWGRVYAARVLRWLTPAAVPFMTLTYDPWKLMSISPWARDIWFATHYARMPAYGWVNQQDKERLKLVMDKMSFSGPYKNIWERYESEVEQREQKRWGTQFHLVVGRKLIDLGGEQGRFVRYPFDFNNKEYVQVLAELMVKGKMAEKVKEKLKLLGVPATTVDKLSVADMRELINKLNTTEVRELANTLQTQWFDSTDVEIEAGKLATAGSKQARYNDWQGTLEVSDRESWVDVAGFQQNNSSMQKVAAKLELALRDLDSWGLKADLTKSEILRHLAEMGERLDAPLARYFYTTAHLYDDHEGQFQFMDRFPEIDNPLDPAKIEQTMNFFDEWSKKTGGLPHIKQWYTTLTFRIWYFKQLADIMFEKRPGVGPDQPERADPKAIMYDPELRRQFAEILEQ